MLYEMSVLLKALLAFVSLLSVAGLDIYVDNTMEAAGSGTSQQPFKYLDDALSFPAITNNDKMEINFIFSRNIKPYTISKSISFSLKNVTINKDAQVQSSEVWIIFEKSGCLKVESGAMQLKYLKIQKISDNTAAKLLWANQLSVLNLTEVDFSEGNLNTGMNLLHISASSALFAVNSSVLSISFVSASTAISSDGTGNVSLINCSFQSNEIKSANLIKVESGPAFLLLKNTSFSSNIIRKDESYPALVKFYGQALTFEGGNFSENRAERGCMVYIGENDKKKVRISSVSFILNSGSDSTNPLLVFSDFLDSAEFVFANIFIKNNIAKKSLISLPSLDTALTFSNFTATENLCFNVLLIENLSGGLSVTNFSCLKNNDAPSNLFNNARLDNYSSCLAGWNIAGNVTIANSTFSSSLSNVGAAGVQLIFPGRAYSPITDLLQTISLENCTFASNLASVASEGPSSSALHIQSLDLTVFLRNCTFEKNSVVNNISLPVLGFFSTEGSLVIENSCFQNNKALRGTVGIHFLGSRLSLKSPIFLNNTVASPNSIASLIKVEAPYLTCSNCTLKGQENFTSLFALSSRYVCEYVLFNASSFSLNRIYKAALINFEDNFKLRKLEVISTEFKSNELNAGFVLLGSTLLSVLKIQVFTLTKVSFTSNKARGLMNFASETETALTIDGATIVSNSFEQGSSAVSIAGLFTFSLLNSNVYSNTVNQSYLISLKSTKFTCYYSNFKDTYGGSALIAWNENTISLKSVIFLNTLLGLLYQGNELIATGVQFKDKILKAGEPQNFLAVKGFNTITFNNFECSGSYLQSAVFDVRSLKPGEFVIDGFKIQSSEGQIFILRNARLQLKNYEIISTKVKPAFNSRESQLVLTSGNWRDIRCELTIEDCGIKAESSVISIERSNFLSSVLNRNNVDSIISLRGSSIAIKACDFSNFSSGGPGGVFIKADLSDVEFSELEFVNSFLALGLLTFSNVSVHSSKFIFAPEADRAIKNAFLRCVTCRAFSVVGSHFENIVSQSPQGACVSLAQKVNTANYFEIIASGFHNITALGKGVGGALFVEEAKITVQSSSFHMNKALRGGAAVFSCRWVNFEYCQFVLEHNSFINNSAELDGGAIKWEFAEIFQKNSTFVNNTARYGNDVSSFPYKLAFEIRNKDSGKVVYNSVENETLFSLENASPGYNLNEGITFFAVDSAGERIKEEVFEDVVMSLKTSFTLAGYRVHDAFAQYYSDMRKSLVNSSIKLLSSKRSTNINADYKFYYEKIEISALLNTSALLLFTVKGLSASYSQVLKLGAFPLSPNEIVDAANASYSIIIPIFFRSCRPGEIYSTASARCTECQEGFFSLRGTETACKPCPPNAVCTGGNQVIVNKGYWRSSTYSENMYQCFGLLNSCEGGFDSKCSNNYIGPLCGDCLYSPDQYYQKSFSGECTVCPPVAGVVFIYLAVWLAFSIFIISVINLVVNPKFSNSCRIFVKIFINYLHLIIILQGYNLSNVPNFFQRGLYGASRFTNFTSFYFSLECIVFAIFGSYKFFYQALVIFTIWLLIIISNAMYCAIRANLRANLWKNIRNRIIIIFFFLWPSSLGYLFSHCMCKSIDGTSYSLVQPTEPCWTQEFSLWMIFFYYPLVLLLGGLLPWKIWRKVNRVIEKKLQKTKNKNKVNMFSSNEDLDLRHAIYSSIKKNTEDSGFYIFLLGYSDPIRGFRWERNSFFLKIIIIMTNYSNAQDDAKVIVVFILMFYLTYSLIWLRPFEHRVYNYFSFAAVLVVYMIIYLLLWYSSDVTDQGSGFLLFLVLFMQLAYFFVWLRFLFKYLKKDVPEQKGTNSSFQEGLDDSQHALNQLGSNNNAGNKHTKK